MAEKEQNDRQQGSQQVAGQSRLQIVGPCAQIRKISYFYFLIFSYSFVKVVYI